ncbi:hypothetical protein ACX0G9_16690 [Flavitalea flava]
MDKIYSLQRPKSFLAAAALFLVCTGINVAGCKNELPFPGGNPLPNGPGGVIPVIHGQQITAANVGRAGAAAANIVNYNPTLTAVSGNKTYSTTQTIRNKQFTGKVLVTGGKVTFEFCSFTYAPPEASAQLQQYNGGAAAGSVICNWCDFDPGLRGPQGNFETCNAQFGERGDANPSTTGASFTLYRCRLQGCGNNIGIHQYRSSGSSVSECFISSPTGGGGTHPDGMEIYSSDNILVLRSRLEIATNTDQSCVNITTDFGNCTTGNPVVIQDNYIDGGTSPVLTRWFNQGVGTYIKNVRYTGNFFGDSSKWGRECDFNSMNVTYNKTYALANPTVIYWDSTNAWAPNGEHVTNPATAPSGDVPAGMPHLPNGFVDARNFYGGEVWRWSGKVLP